jgi:hypothetical protein
MHERAFCLTTNAPLALAEIERRMRADGYDTSGPAFWNLSVPRAPKERPAPRIVSRVWALAAA